MTVERRALGRAALLAVPGLALAVVGLFHPRYLVIGTAERWTMLHVAGLFVFPLVGVALVMLMSGRDDVVGWLVRVTAFVYAAAYSALDVISGIGAGYVTWRLGENVIRPDEVRYLFVIGGRLGEVGSWALIACTVVVAADAIRQRGPVAVPGVLLVPGAVLVHSDHIFAPNGVLGMTFIGLATGWLGWVGLSPARHQEPTTHRRSRGSRAGRG
ncbi:hypothetical protein [Nocardioides sp. InS609-2]|uniref:hypothetical protein n=1 Tax=Nocardioides sp. InS609-2 TaxID=2760705 RepID=UPI0020BFEE1A|nr:hypothetical protein [Nocardioides sp. InS609-2]